MWWQDLLMGFWNGLTAWIVLVMHVFGGWPEFPLYDSARSGNWYDFGFLLGAGSPFLGSAGRRSTCTGTHAESTSVERRPLFDSPPGR
jgi:hypothetical protein